MMPLASFFLFCFAYSLSVSPCQPFGLRVYYGDILLDQASSQKAVVYFNTQDSCLNSFVNVLSTEGFKKIMCQHLEIETSSFANFYIAYVHKCSIDYIEFEQIFTYIAYGWDQGLSNFPTPHKNSWVDIIMIDPRSSERQVKLVSLADWGNIKAKINNLTPITNDLKKVLIEQQIHAILIDGDIAYDLDSNNGTNYEEFLMLLEQFSAKIPIIHIPGNHERRTRDAALLFNSSFKIYGIDKTLATGLSFGSVYLVPFDPYNIIYGFKQSISSLETFKNELSRGKLTGRFIIACSHYPLICSAQSRCYDGFVLLQDYFDAMIDNEASLHIGGHTHSYQRNYPYFKDHSFLKMQSPYHSEGNYIISVVEGVAGNDNGIVDTMKQKKQYTARYTVNQTGFAVIKSTKAYVEYSHYSTKQGFMDRFQIIKKTQSQLTLKRDNLQLYNQDQLS